MCEGFPAQTALASSPSNQETLERAEDRFEEVELEFELPNSEIQANTEQFAVDLADLSSGSLGLSESTMELLNWAMANNSLEYVFEQATEETHVTFEETSKITSSLKRKYTSHDGVYQVADLLATKKLPEKRKGREGLRPMRLQ